MSDMKVKAIAPWFGGKRTMAPEIAAELGPHAQYFEPFCGSMAVLFAKEPSRNETVNDLHGDMINLARALQDESTAVPLYDRLQRTLFCEALIDDARRCLQDYEPAGDGEISVDRAYWYFLTSWQCRNGTAGTRRIDYQVAVRWTKNGGSPTVRWQNTVDSIPAWHRRLKNVVILKRDAFDIIEKFEDDRATAIYVDPPYLYETRGDGHGSKHGGSGQYLHEFSHARPGKGLFQQLDDHSRLAEVLKSYKSARVVVSYYDCARVRELYDGWTVVDKRRQKHLHVQNKRGTARKDAQEILLINGPALR